MNSGERKPDNMLTNTDEQTNKQTRAKPPILISADELFPTVEV